MRFLPSGAKDVQPVGHFRWDIFSYSIRGVLDPLLVQLLLQ